MTLYHKKTRAGRCPIHIAHRSRRNPPGERCKKHGDLRLIRPGKLSVTVDGVEHQVAAGHYVFVCPDCLHDEHAPIQKWTSGGPTLLELAEKALEDVADEIERALEPVDEPAHPHNI